MDFSLFRQEMQQLLTEIRVKQDRQGEEIASIGATVARVDERTLNMKDTHARTQGFLAIAISALAFIWSLITSGHSPKL